jgi:hypothetical protein
MKIILQVLLNEETLEQKKMTKLELGVEEKNINVSLFGV